MLDVLQKNKAHKTAVLAVDNDPASENCRQRNPELSVLIPKNKDWNEDLCDIKQIDA